MIFPLVLAAFQMSSCTANSLTLGVAKVIVRVAIDEVALIRSIWVLYVVGYFHEGRRLRFAYFIIY
jgi:hypothetical protein